MRSIIRKIIREEIQLLERDLKTFPINGLYKGMLMKDYVKSKYFSSKYKEGRDYYLAIDDGIPYAFIATSNRLLKDLDVVNDLKKFKTNY